MERKIGERFDYNGVTLEVVKQLGCKGCYFFNMLDMSDCNNLEIRGHCGISFRTDKKPVIFKEVEK